MEVGERGRLYTYRYTVTTRMTCIKMASDESHFNVSLTVRDKVARQCQESTTTTIWECYGPSGKAGTTQPSFIHFTDASLRVLL